MRVKPLPPPPDDLGTVRAAQRAVPLVPAPEPDCCARLGDRLDLSSRDAARTWLTFLRGLGLVAEGDRGFYRRRVEPGQAYLAEAVPAGVFGARETLAALTDEPQPAAQVFEAIEQHVPNWERSKHPGAWRERWRRRTADLLDWLVLLELADREDAGYRRR